MSVVLMNRKWKAFSFLALALALFFSFVGNALAASALPPGGHTGSPSVVMQSNWNWVEWKIDVDPSTTFYIELQRLSGGSWVTVGHKSQTISGTQWIYFYQEYSGPLKVGATYRILITNQSSHTAYYTWL